MQIDQDEQNDEDEQDDQDEQNDEDGLEWSPEDNLPKSIDYQSMIK